MAIKKNVILRNLSDYVHYVRGVKKVGKTTLFRDLVLQEYGDESKGLLCSFGDEDGFKSLDRLQYEEFTYWDITEADYVQKIMDQFVEKLEETQMDSMTTDEIYVKAEKQTNQFIEKFGKQRGFVQLVDDLVLNNDEIGIEFIAYDTIDKMIEVATVEVIRLSMMETGKPCKSINAAWGGYGEGKKRLAKLIQDQTTRLKQIGLCPMVLGHTKYKDKTDEMSGAEYSQLTTSLNSDLDAIFGDTAQVVCTISIDKIIVEGKITGTQRMLHFRDDGIVDCGSRFTGMPDSMELSSANYIEAFDIGVKNSYLTAPPVTQPKVEAKTETKASKVKAEVKEDAPVDNSSWGSTEAAEPTEPEYDLKTLIKMILSTIKQKQAQKVAVVDIMKVLTNNGVTDPNKITDVEVAKKILQEYK
ncbi:AAA family ATPase [Clostridium sp. FP2]|uniref:AAA family ATPase n=1 Tax=Clostridium sp. FP2 TaxID=2724481 RepID=UPI0013E91C72|nr:AAA family ATPase [Clostridium sp. FP2]MBZ9622939.1 AAA family ATPase [Clostridium sp. FP2]